MRVSKRHAIFSCRLNIWGRIYPIRTRHLRLPLTRFANPYTLQVRTVSKLFQQRYVFNIHYTHRRDYTRLLSSIAPACRSSPVHFSVADFFAGWTLGEAGIRASEKNTSLEVMLIRNGKNVFIPTGFRESDPPAGIRL